MAHRYSDTELDEGDFTLTEGSPLPERGWALPGQIETDDRFNVRLYETDDAREMQEIEWLAEAIERDGQLDDVILVPVEEGRIVLLAGHRRRRAVALINERRSALNQPLLKLRYYVNRDGGDLYRKAIISNLQRKDFSPMNLALLIGRIRERNKWEGFKGAKRIAEYLGISVATVTQHEKFLSPDMDQDLKDKLHAGVISAQSAFDLLQVKPAKREEVLERAQEIQADKNIDQAIHQTESGKETAEGAAKKMHSKRRIENPAVRQAIREIADATDTPQPITRRELVEFILQFDAPVYGTRKGAVRQWVLAMDRMMTGAAGKMGEKIAIEKFDAMVANADQGEPDEEGGEPKKDKSHTVSGRLSRRDKGIKKPRTRPTLNAVAAAASGKSGESGANAAEGKPPVKKAGKSKAARPAKAAKAVKPPKAPRARKIITAPAKSKTKR